MCIVEMVARSSKKILKNKMVEIVFNLEAMKRTEEES